MKHTLDLIVIAATRMSSFSLSLLCVLSSEFPVLFSLLHQISEYLKVYCVYLFHSFPSAKFVF